MANPLRSRLFLLFCVAHALFLGVAAKAADRKIDLSLGCKAYILKEKKWVPFNGAMLDGKTISESSLLKDEEFSVFKVQKKTYGLNRKCLVEAVPQANEKTEEKKHSSLPPELRRGDTQSPWAAAFSLGYNLAPNGTLTASYGGTTASDSVKFKSSITFIGEGSYRLAPLFRVAGEFGLSQLTLSSQTGNETSFIDVKPELVLPLSPKVELYAGPMLGFFFFSQNTETQNRADGSAISIRQQNVTTLLLGAEVGADFFLSKQFDLGLFFRYFKPGDIKITGTVTSPTTGTFESTLSASYMTLGTRFVIHF